MTRMLMLQCAVILVLLTLFGCSGEPSCAASRFVTVATAQDRSQLRVVTLDTCSGIVREQVVGPPPVLKPLPVPPHRGV